MEWPEFCERLEEECALEKSIISHVLDDLLLTIPYDCQFAEPFRPFDSGTQYLQIQPGWYGALSDVVHKSSPIGTQLLGKFCASFGNFAF